MTLSCDCEFYVEGRHIRAATGIRPGPCKTPCWCPHDASGRNVMVISVRWSLYTLSIGWPNKTKIAVVRASGLMRCTRSSRIFSASIELGRSGANKRTSTLDVLILMTELFMIRCAVKIHCIHVV